MIFKKKRRRKKIKTKYLWWLVVVMIVLLLFPFPTASGSSQGLQNIGDILSSSWTKLRIKAERGADALAGVSVVGSTSDDDEAEVIKKGDELPSSEMRQAPTELIDVNWTFELYPNYYLIAGESNLDLSLFPNRGEIVYSELDYLGRTGVVRGSLTYANVAASYGIRQEFTADANPSGWTINDKASIVWLNGKVYNGYFWNRSHLIADSLGGDAIRQNVITGTRTQNVGGTDQQGGMRYSEKLVQTYIEGHHDVTVYYEADPIYYGEEIVPRYVEVSFLSSDGALDQKVIVFNTANGYSIDYTTGEFYEN